MPQVEQAQGVDSKTLEDQGRKSLEKALGDKKDQVVQEQQQQNEGNQNEESNETQGSSQQEQQQVQQSNQQQDATGENELVQYDNILKNTFGFTEDKITDEARKVAKSWSELQSKTTKVQQEKKEYQNQLQRFNQLFDKDPSLYEHANAVANGKSYNENPNQQDSTTEQPQQQTGQLDSESVDENTLINQGYLKKEDLEGLEGLARERKLMKAEMRYEKDRMRDNFKNELIEERENLTKQEQEAQIKELNQERLTKGLDNFVTKTGFNLAELDDEIFEEIQQSAIWDRDHTDPRKVKEDAFETAARRVLSREGLLSEQQQQVQQQKKQQMQDTGVTVNQQQKQQNRNKSLAEELRDRAKKNAANSYSDPKAEYFKN